MTEQTPNALDLAQLRAELNALAEFLQAGGSPEEMLASLQELAQGTPPEAAAGTGTGEKEETEGETPPETPPETEPAPAE